SKGAEPVWFDVVESRLHGRRGCGTPSTAAGLLLEELAIGISRPDLAKHTTGAQVVDQQAKEVSLGRVFARDRTVDVQPDLASGDARALVDLGDHLEVQLVVPVDPLDEEPNQIVRCHR